MQGNDVVQNRLVGLKCLIEIAMGLFVEKNDADKFSNWNQDELSPN